MPQQVGSVAGARDRQCVVPGVKRQSMLRRLLPQSQPRLPAKWLPARADDDAVASPAAVLARVVESNLANGALRKREACSLIFGSAEKGAPGGCCCFLYAQLAHIHTHNNNMGACLLIQTTTVTTTGWLATFFRMPRRLLAMTVQVRVCVSARATAHSGLRSQARLSVRVCARRYVTHAARLVARRMAHASTIQQQRRRRQQKGYETARSD